MGTIVRRFDIARDALLGLVGVDVHCREELVNALERFVLLLALSAGWRCRWVAVMLTGLAMVQNPRKSLCM